MTYGEPKANCTILAWAMRLALPQNMTSPTPSQIFKSSPRNGDLLPSRDELSMPFGFGKHKNSSCICVVIIFQFPGILLFMSILGWPAWG